MTLNEPGLNWAGPPIRTCLRLRLPRVSHQQIQAAGWETVFSHSQPQIPNRGFRGDEGATLKSKVICRFLTAPTGAPALFKGHPYARNTIMKYQQGKLKKKNNTSCLERRQINTQDSALYWS